MIEYTEEQLEAIKPQGSMVITACPGSGKTAVISQKIKNELLELKSHQGVIAITFTRKASKELEARCRSGGSEIRRSFFGTIDSFCLSEIIYPFLNQILGGSTENLEPKYDTDLKEFEQEHAKLLKDIDEIDNTTLEAINELYKGGTLYFPTIPALAVYIHKKSRACRGYLTSRYKTIYIDEYQDSSKPQHTLFLNIVASGITGVAVGDLQQSIYGWRRCSPEYLKELIRHDDFSHRTVSYNHRCHPSISNYANRLFNENFELSATDKIQVWQCKFEGTQRDAAVKLNDIIPALLQRSSHFKASDIAVLVRNNRSLTYLREHLTLECRIFSEDAIDALQSRNGMLWGNLLRYRFDPTICPDQVLENLPDYSSAARATLAASRRIVKKVRSIETNMLEDYLLTTSSKLLGLEVKKFEQAALRRVLSDPEALRQYTPTTDDEIQCMTLHKSKGLEFEVVIHLDLTEWIFPYQKSGEKYGIFEYPDWEQDLNLHFVGITRAKSICMLVYNTQRINANDQVKPGGPSRFLSLPGLKSLYLHYNPK